MLLEIAMPPLTEPATPIPLSRVIGNAAAAEAIRTAMIGAKMRNQTLGHILLQGPSGVGKTHFAKLIAEDAGASMTRIHGPSITRRNLPDLMRAFIQLNPNDVLFIDEIHTLPTEAMECLYEAMEEMRVSIPTADGQDSPAFVTVPLSPFVLVGATTRPGKLTEPLQMRFVRTITLATYSIEELAMIIEMQSFGTGASGQQLTDCERLEIATRSRGRARKAIRFAEVCLDHKLTGGSVLSAFSELKIGPHGETESDRTYIRTLAEKLNGGPAGISAIIATSGLDPLLVERDIEPFLLDAGVIKRTPRGRQIIGTLSPA